MVYDSEEYFSSNASVFTAIRHLSHDLGNSSPTGGTLSTTGKREPCQEFLETPAAGSSQQYETPALPDSGAQTSPGGSAINDSRKDTESFSELWESITLLWPLPAGDPLLPPDLQAVPYPTAPKVRPPLSPILQHHPDQGHHLPSISQLIVAASSDCAKSPGTTISGSTALFNDDIIDEGFEDSAGLAALNQPVLFDPTSSHALQALSKGDGPGDSSQPMVFETHLDADDSWRLGFMRLHRERKTQTSQ
ncbi:hypothetical protein H2200_002167 [Cladophialophora chaetospira]|uniref:Uncharacterized protein n=1 Tax=Cladophialophora chaetospira TaxID=386627 RepID=A0AA39CLW3_9EURO|nr:hypothetical protein H2200_002167 [Cladophialophora chaetospira]